MRTKFFKLFLLITFLFLSNGDFLAQVNWTKYPGNPVLIGQQGTWYAYTTMNSVLYNADSSRYEMWFTAGAQIEIPYTIGFAWSSDGISWNVYSANPVLTPTPGSWDAYTVLAPYVIRENGQYKMWYTGCATNQFLNRIGYATSPDGINWIKHSSNPVLTPGTEPWESAGVAYPCIMPYSNGYKMWYGGYSANLSVSALGYATSPDGITWEKYAGNPVLPPGAVGQWDHIVFAPRVLYIDNNYYMFYTGETVVYQSDKIGLATSPDGLVWTKYSSNPVLQPTPGQWDGGRTSLGSVLMDAGILKMYYCGMTAGGTNMQLGLATSVFSPPLLPGTYTIGTGGNFATIQEAFNKLETDGVAGNVTLELIDELYTAPTDSFGFKLNGPIPGAGPNSRVTIKPALDKNVIVEGAGYRIFSFYNTSYLTLDGVDISGSTTLTFHGDPQLNWLMGVTFAENSDYNIIQHLTIILEDKGYETDGIAIWGSATSDNNIIQNNFIKSADVGIIVAGKNQNTKATGNIISGNKIGLETDSLITIGIGTWALDNSIIENNVIQNLRQQQLIYWDIALNFGISLSFSSNSIVRGNVVHNMKANSLQGSTGIWVAGDAVNGYGNDNLVYNNMVYDIQSISTQSDSRVSGIQLWYQNNPKIYYNSVYLSGTGANQLGSAALFIHSNVSNADIKNNIFVNIRDESPYCASAIYDYSSANLTSDYNDLYYDDTNNNNCLVRAGGTDYLTLADWQATGKDLHSYVEMPHFVDPYLHIDSTIATFLEARGTPIAEVTTDFDGQLRNALTPDIGADEFDGIVGVEDEETLPTEFALSQNYPNPFNPTTTFRYSIPAQSKVVIKVFDVLGNEIVTLMDEEKSVGTYELTWNAASHPSGVYFYQLKAGEFVNTKKMILLK
jgi:predicted GH43/DUF377 family glycosyl hydrolase